MVLKTYYNSEKEAFVVIYVPEHKVNALQWCIRRHKTLQRKKNRSHIWLIWTPPFPQKIVHYMSCVKYLMQNSGHRAFWFLLSEKRRDEAIASQIECVGLSLKPVVLSFGERPPHHHQSRRTGGALQNATYCCRNLKLWTSGINPKGDWLKTRRKIRWNQNTKIISEIATALQSSALYVNSLENLQDRLIACSEEFCKVIVKIELHISDADPETDYVSVADCEDGVAGVLGELCNKIARCWAATTVTSPEADLDRDDPSHTTEVKLLKLQLLQYRGKLTQWQSFREQLDAAVCTLQHQAL